MKEASTEDARASPSKKSTKAIAPPNTPTTARPAHCAGRDGRVSTAPRRPADIAATRVNSTSAATTFLAVV
ncbi:MAG TPA: hypothetical protein VIJ07_24285 [Dermatophilaceae bacterium]